MLTERNSEHINKNVTSNVCFRVQLMINHEYHEEINFSILLVIHH